MLDLLEDIQTLENAVIALTEGASDEKRSALMSLENLIKQKQRIVQDAENEYNLDIQQGMYA